MLADPDVYFSVNHDFNAYLSPHQGPLPEEPQLSAMRSVGLQLLSEVKALESSCLLQLRQLDNEAKAVVDFLKLQSRKVDMVLHYVLENETRDGKHYQGRRFGGSGFVVECDTPMGIGDCFKVTLYIRDELLALVCIASVIRLEPHQDGFAAELEYRCIMPEDVEQLVKASLSVQQKQLKARKPPSER